LTSAELNFRHRIRCQVEGQIDTPRSADLTPQIGSQDCCLPPLPGRQIWQSGRVLGSCQIWLLGLPSWTSSWRGGSPPGMGDPAVLPDGRIPGSQPDPGIRQDPGCLEFLEFPPLGPEKCHVLKPRDRAPITVQDPSNSPLPGNPAEPRILGILGPAGSACQAGPAGPAGSACQTVLPGRQDGSPGRVLGRRPRTLPDCLAGACPRTLPDCCLPPLPGRQIWQSDRVLGTAPRTRGS